jgi:hypothetical protein
MTGEASQNGRVANRNLAVLIPRILERWYPPAVGLGALGLSRYVLRKIDQTLPSSALQQAFASTVDIGAIAIGFLATALSVILSLQGTKADSFMRSSGLHDDVRHYMLKAIQWSFALVVVSLAFVLVDAFQLSAEQRSWELSVWVSVLVTAGLACLRVLGIFFRILMPSDQRLLQQKRD